MNKFANLLIFQFLIVILICPVFLSFSQPIAEDNLSILTRLTAEIADSLRQFLILDSAAVVSLQAVSQKEQSNWIIENEFFKELTPHGCEVIIGEATNLPICQVIEFSTNIFGVKYLETTKKKFVERQVSAHLDFRITQGLEKKVILLKNFNKTFRDTIAIVNIPRLETDRYPFTRAEIPARQEWTKFIEPFIVAVITSGIVYLFFALRSK